MKTARELELETRLGECEVALARLDPKGSDPYWKWLTPRLGVTTQKAKIEPVPEAGDHKTGCLLGITAKKIQSILGFPANIVDDPYKVKYSWGFTYEGKRCGIWDYKGSYKEKYFSTFGPSEVFRELFGDKYYDDDPSRRR